MLSSFGSGVDYPLSAFPDEMLAAFVSVGVWGFEVQPALTRRPTSQPDAKFVLTVRPASTWFDSIRSSICWFHAHDNLPFKVLLRLPFFPFDRIKQQRSVSQVVDARFQILFDPLRLHTDDRRHDRIQDIVW